MRSKLIIAILLAAFLWGLKSHLGGMWFYTWVTLFRPQDFAWVPIPNLVPTAVAILALSLVIGALRREYKFRWNIGSFHLMSFIFISFLSYSFSDTPNAAWEKFVQILKIIMPSLLICNSISSEKDFRTLVLTYAGSVGLWAIQAAIHGIGSGGAVENMAIGGQMSERNDFAVGIVMTFPLWYCFGMIFKKKLAKYGALFGAFLVAVAAIFSNSRGAMLGLAVVCMFIFFRKGTKRVRNFFLFIVIAPLAVLMVPDFAVKRLSTIELSAQQTDGSARSRLILMKGGLAGAMDNPVFGVGPGCWKLHYHRYVMQMGDGAYEPHSIWIKAAAELGFVGLGTYLLMILNIMWKLRKIQVRCFEENRMKIYHYAGMLQLSLLGYCASGSFINQVYYEYMFLIIAASGAMIKMWNLGELKEENE